MAETTPQIPAYLQKQVRAITLFVMENKNYVRERAENIPMKRWTVGAVMLCFTVINVYSHNYNLWGIWNEGKWMALEALFFRDELRLFPEHLQGLRQDLWQVIVQIKFLNGLGGKK